MNRLKAALLASALALAPGGALAASPPSDEALAQRADLDAFLALALERNPDLREARVRILAAEKRAEVAGGLPDPALRYQLWAAPFARPWKPEMHMLGLEQELPAFGSRGARERAGRAEAAMTAESERARALDVAQQVKRAFFELSRVDRERRIREEHIRLAERIHDLARASYQTGRVSQQDVLRASVEVSRLQTDLASLDQARASSAALLNTLAGRAPDAPIGPAADRPAPADPPGLDALERDLAARPEIASSRHAIARSEAQLDAARRTARLPSLMLGADYMYSPMGTEHRHGFSAMVSVSLPWINPRHGDEVAEAEHSLEADRRAGEAALTAARFQLRDALFRLKAARTTFELLERDLVPRARQSFEAAQSAFAANQGDALGLLDAERSYLQVRIDRERALAQLETSLADLERAAGHAARPTEEKR